MVSQIIQIQCATLLPSGLIMLMMMIIMLMMVVMMQMLMSQSHMSQGGLVSLVVRP